MSTKDKVGFISPGSAAMIMALGIFLVGAIDTVVFIQSHIEYYFAIGLLILWCFVYGLLSIQFFNRNFLTTFLSNPISSFLVGTWIAGVSVLCHVLLKYFPSWIYLIRIIATINVILALPFLILCFRNMIKLYSSEQRLVHGVLLLSTVGIQSIVLLWHKVFFVLPVWLFEMVVLMGLGFYMLSMVLILKRYLRRGGWTLVHDWTNTNCIIHGALSITGFAIVSTQVFSSVVVV